MRTFLEAALAHGTDKVTEHRFQDVYPRYLECLRGSAFTMLEVGVDDGKSIRTWREYFPKARVVGVDINPTPIMKEEDMYVMDVRSFHFEELVRGLGPLTLVIDDGGHWPALQRRVFDLTWPRLVTSGWFFCEDLQVVRKDDFAGQVGDMVAGLLRDISDASEIHAHREIVGMRKA